MADWFGPNPYLLQGSITIKTALPEIRIGQRVIIDTGDPARPIQFYVEGVSISVHAPTATAGASGQTTLIVTRGFVGDDDALLAATIKLSNLYQPSAQTAKTATNTTATK